MGHIKIIPEGMDTCRIREDERDDAVRKFLIMKNSAEQEKDVLWVASSFYSHHFSFGNFYSDFVYQTWEKVQHTPSLKGIQQTTLQLISNSWERVPKEIADNEFLLLAHPLTTAGLKQPAALPEYIYDDESWQRWHDDWFIQHQEMINWQHAVHALFPQPKRIEAILKREVEKHGIQPADDYVTQFHSEVMKKKGPQLEAYAIEVGTEICKKNFYVFERELSKNEQRIAGARRMIFSIINSLRKKQYISIDFAHGMFEFFDEHGKHKGEYRFDGSYNADPEEDHSLKTL